jgi:hypothetical protein
MRGIRVRCVPADHRRVDQLATAVNAEMRLHAELPLIALFCLMHLGIAKKAH